MIWVMSSMTSLKLTEYYQAKVKVLVVQSCLTLCDPMDCSLLDSLFIGFSRQEYWSGLPIPSQGDLPDPRMEPRSLALQADSYCLSHQGKL